MKLLLTSAGITNKYIEKALLDILGKPFNKSKLVFITTAANVVAGDKTWMIDNIVQFKNLNFLSIDIIDIANINEKIWLPRLLDSDVIVFGGGNQGYLMSYLNKINFKNILSKKLKDKIYFGISAGSMIVSNKLSTSLSEKILDEKIDNYIKDEKSLDLLDFQIVPHFNSKFFPNNKIKNIKTFLKNSKEKIYFIDDNTAIKVVDKNIEIITDGKYFKSN